jgi:hypothetical protein
MLDECLNLSQEVANDWMRGLTLVELGITARFQGNLDLATTYEIRGLDLLRVVGDAWGLAFAVRRNGFTALRLRDYDRAAASFTEGLALGRNIDDRLVTEECIKGLALVASAQKECERAARLFGAAEMLREDLGYRRSSWYQACHDEHFEYTRSALSEAVFMSALAEGRAMTLEQAIEYALVAETD